MNSPVLRTMAMTLSPGSFNLPAKSENNSGTTDITNTPSKRPLRKIGRVNWIDQRPGDLPLTGLLMKSRSAPWIFAVCAKVFALTQIGAIARFRQIGKARMPLRSITAT